MEIKKFLEEHDIPVKGIYWGMKKWMFLFENKEKVMVHFDDDIRTCRQLTNVGIPTFLVGAFTSTTYMEKWIEAVSKDGQLQKYAPTCKNLESAIKSVTHNKLIVEERNYLKA